MAEIIRTIALTDNTAITSRDIAESGAIDAIDVNQVDGSILTAESNSDGEYLGKVTVYSQDSSEAPYEFTSVLRGGSLNYTLDARFNHIRRKIWIADTGNHRVIKLNRNDYSTDVIVDDVFYYPHSIAVNYNNAGIFVKAYADIGMEDIAVYYLRSNGEELASFRFNPHQFGSSSSSSSSSFDSSSSSSNLDSISSDSSSSSSGTVIQPSMPHNRSMAFDYVRSRLWWVDGRKVYLLDVRGKQVETYDIGSNGYFSTRTVDVDLNTGNAFVVSENIHGQWFLVQMNRDNNKYLGSFRV